MSQIKKASAEQLAQIVAGIAADKTLDEVAFEAGTHRNRLGTLAKRHPEIAKALAARRSAPRSKAALKPAVAKPKPPKPTPAVEAERAWRETPDTRPIASSNTVASALGAATRASQEVLIRAGLVKANDTRGPRFALPPSWPALRAAYHALPDDVRRAALLQLIGEESQRMEHDRGASFDRVAV